MGPDNSLPWGLCTEVFSSNPGLYSLWHPSPSREWCIPQVAQRVTNPPANAGDIGDEGSILGWGRSSGEGNGNPFQYSCLKNPMDRGTCQATVHGVTKSQTGLSTHTHTHTQSHKNQNRSPNIAKHPPAVRGGKIVSA